MIHSKLINIQNDTWRSMSSVLHLCRVYNIKNWKNIYSHFYLMEIFLLIKGKQYANIVIELL